MIFITCDSTRRCFGLDFRSSFYLFIYLFTCLLVYLLFILSSVSWLALCVICFFRFRPSNAFSSRLLLQMWQERSLEFQLQTIYEGVGVGNHRTTNQIGSFSDFHKTQERQWDEAAGPFEDIVKVEDLPTLTYELESGSPDCIVPLNVKGRLKANVQFWEKIDAPPFHYQLEGYKIPFYVTSPTAAFNNNRSALQHSEFVQSSIL